MWVRNLFSLTEFFQARCSILEEVVNGGSKLFEKSRTLRSLANDINESLTISSVNSGMSFLEWCELLSQSEDHIETPLTNDLKTRVFVVLACPSLRESALYPLAA
jgi:hypothetical protein